MSIPTKLSLCQKREIRRRSKDGESQRALGDAFGVHKRTIWNILKASEEELEKADMRPRRIGRPTERPRREPKAHVEPVLPPPAPALPASPPLPPQVYLYTHVRHGDVTATREGSYIQKDHGGRIVKVLSCPVYDSKWRFLGRYDVEMMEASIPVNAFYTRWSGEKVEGTVTFTVAPPHGEITRVEFIPADAPLKELVQPESR